MDTQKDTTMGLYKKPISIQKFKSVIEHYLLELDNKAPQSTTTNTFVLHLMRMFVMEAMKFNMVNLDT
ncbi:MAG: hypothetical protein WA421_09535 [Nitrososphaeraceae archaeon]